MKKVLLITGARTPRSVELADGFADKIRHLVSDDVIIENCEISELFFELDAESVAIYHPKKEYDIREFDLVIVRFVGEYLVEAHAVAVYCETFGIQYTDTYFNRLLLDKLSAQFALWFDGIRNWPRTMYGPVEEMKRRLPEFGEKAVLKDNKGSKGRLNFVVFSPEQLQLIIDENPGIFFVLQEYIPNKGDLRVLVLDEVASLVIRRTGNGSSHLNNTSQGGVAEIVPLNDIEPDILRIAERAAKLLKLQVAGVDVMYDERTNEPYLLEVNNAPQISSGSFIDEKADLYANMIQSMLQDEDTA